MVGGQAPRVGRCRGWGRESLGRGYAGGVGLATVALRAALSPCLVGRISVAGGTEPCRSKPISGHIPHIGCGEVEG